MVFRENGRIRDLAPLLPAGMRSGAGAINAANEVMGLYTTMPWPHVEDARAFVWRPTDGMHLLPLPEGYDYVVPTDMNDRGIVTGWGCGAAGCGGFRGSVATGLQPFAPDDLPAAINERGQVVGSSVRDTGPAFLWDAAGGLRDLPLLPGAGACFARDINARGVVVGDCAGSDGGPVAWYPDAAGYRVAKLLPLAGGVPDPYPACGGETCWYGQTAVSINDAGLIVVRIATYPYGYIEEGDLLLLTPLGRDGDAS